MTEPLTLALTHHVQDGPFGGGNQAIRAIRDCALDRGHKVVQDLKSGPVDLILMTEVRQRSPQMPFGQKEIVRHLFGGGWRTLVVHRINECDERKGTRTMNRRLKLANALADHTVFIGSWLQDLELWCRGPNRRHSVILNGADTRLFRPDPSAAWTPDRPLNLVTHHWGGNRLKGFDVYEALDAALDDPAQARRFTLTYIGNVPNGVTFRNVRMEPPLAGAGLGARLRTFDAYLTASRNEPAGMHHIEGALSGLPLLYRRSGALPEYCDGYGEVFDGPGDILAALDRMRSRHPHWRETLKTYPHTAERMAASYVDLFEALCSDRETLLAQRRLFCHPLALLSSQVRF